MRVRVDRRQPALGDTGSAGIEEFVSTAANYLMYLASLH